MKYSFSITNRWGETLNVSDCHSLEEAITHVERGVYERDLAIGRRLHAGGSKLPPDIYAKLVVSGEIKEAAPVPETPVEVPASKPSMTEVYDEKGDVIPPAPAK
jgi:hypothetical protein